MPLAAREVATSIDTPVFGSTGFGYVRDPATGAYERFPQIRRLLVEDDVELEALCTKEYFEALVWLTKRRSA